MNEKYKMRGTISKVTDVEILTNGAAKLSYRVDTDNEYAKVWEFEIYKGADHVEHAHNFAKFNQVGDEVEVEFEIKPRIWEEKDRVFTSLSHWKCTKLEDQATDQATDQVISDDLPF